MTRGPIITTAPVRTASPVDSAFRRQLEGYGLTTASILYRMPDHPSFLQEFIWQDYDLFPKFPVLQTFIDFWKREIDGALHSIRVAHNRLITPAELRTIGAEFRLN
ncbi:MAG: Usg family [Beijerinckiaceae bacterium]|nr:MAG: Usg family [Beijerinckiaceae bacterium]